MEQSKIMTLATTLEDAWMNTNRRPLRPEEMEAFYVEVSPVYRRIRYEILQRDGDNRCPVILATRGAGVTTGLNWLVAELAKEGVPARCVDAGYVIREGMDSSNAESPWYYPRRIVALVLEAMMDIATETFGESWPTETTADGYRAQLEALKTDDPDGAEPYFGAINALATAVEMAIHRLPVVMLDGLELLLPETYHRLYDSRAKWVARFTFPVIYTAGIYEEPSHWFCRAGGTETIPYTVKTVGSTLNLQPSDEGAALMNVVLKRMDTSLIDADALALASRFSDGPWEMLDIISGALLMAMRRQERNPEEAVKVTLHEVTYQVHQHISDLTCRYDSHDNRLLAHIRNHHWSDFPFYTEHREDLERCILGGAVIADTDAACWMLHPQMLSFQVGVNLGIEDAGFTPDDTAGRTGYYVEKVGAGYLRRARVFGTMDGEVILLLTDGVESVRVPEEEFHEDLAEAKAELREYQFQITSRFSSWHMQSYDDVMNALMGLAMPYLATLPTRDLYQKNDDVLPSERDVIAITIAGATLHWAIEENKPDNLIPLEILQDYSAANTVAEHTRRNIWKSVKRYLTDVAKDVKNGIGVLGILGKAYDTENLPSLNEIPEATEELENREPAPVDVADAEDLPVDDDNTDIGGGSRQSRWMTWLNKSREIHDQVGRGEHRRALDFGRIV